ncbi:hypothetical protein IMZ48_08235, partial [Candidatus Bathyarchaeota archaeon]|nr:hypothetical protein [Candidatus Bathyarchaeota archaeon]
MLTRPRERSEALPNTWFNWVKPFFKIKDTAVLHHSTLDAYLFLRYLKILALITFVGCCITWPILLPLHAKGGGGKTQLDSLTMGNITNKDMHYAHALVAYVFFGMSATASPPHHLPLLTRVQVSSCSPSTASASSTSTCATPTSCRPTRRSASRRGPSSSCVC